MTIELQVAAWLTLFIIFNANQELKNNFLQFHSTMLQLGVKC